MINAESHLDKKILNLLISSGFEINIICGESKFYEYLESRNPDLILLASKYDNDSILTIIKKIRNEFDGQIFLLSSRSEENKKIKALDAGIDDYLTSSIGVGEFSARIRTAMRRYRKVNPPVANLFYFGNVIVNFKKKTVSKSNKKVPLTPTEYKLFSVLLRNSGFSLKTEDLLKKVWGKAHISNVHYLRIFIAGLRNKLEDNPAHPIYILTEKTVGYRFAPKRVIAYFQDCE